VHADLDRRLGAAGRATSQAVESCPVMERQYDHQTMSSRGMAAWCFHKLLLSRSPIIVAPVPRCLSLTPRPCYGASGRRWRLQRRGIGEVLLDDPVDGKLKTCPRRDLQLAACRKGTAERG
jgi:hypothetical protein